MNIGGPAVGNYVADFGCSGTLWGPANDPNMGNQSGVYQTLRYGPAFTASYVTSNGFYIVNLLFLEPNKTGPGQRRFTIMVNGLLTQVIDLFALAGLMVPYTLTVPAIVTNGNLSMQFTATVGNAVLSGIEIQPQAESGLPPLPTEQPGPGGITVV